MLTVGTITGNIFDARHEYGEEYERVVLERFEMQKSRILKRTDRGTDVGLLPGPGRTLRHGDIITDGSTYIVVEQAPERVISVRMRPGAKATTETLVLVGHVIGNRHRPVSIKDGTVYFPVQADSELRTFERLFSGVSDSMVLSLRDMIFSPHDGADVHDHR